MESFTDKYLESKITKRVSIVSCHFVDKKIELTKRYSPDSYLLTDPPKKFPDRLVKEIYGVVNGEIALIATEKGTVVPEKITWEVVE